MHSPWAAIKLVMVRLSKCHPFGSFGEDPVPKKSPGSYQEKLDPSKTMNNASPSDKISPLYKPLNKIDHFNLIKFNKGKMNV
jgi:hypothetical protein